MSADLQWMIIRNNSSFLVKRRAAPTLTTEPNNLKNKNNFRFNGLVHRRTLGINAAEDGKGVVFVSKNSGYARKPAKHFTKVELKKGSRKSLNTIRRVIRKNRYRKDLKMTALRRASAILQSQKPVIVRKSRGKKKE